MKLVITDEATADLREIGEWIAANNPRRALSFVDELKARCTRLIDAPLAYSLVPRHEASGVRRLSHGAYLIFYRVRDDAVEVIHVLHGARNYEAILFPDRA
jgi:plasmid stabilization system protein ParE